jgi:transposase
VAMASTGVYWIPLYDLWEHEGFPVLRVDPRQVQRAPNRPKTDVHDCQGFQRRHRLGLLPAAFRPEEPSRVWRAYQRHRATLIEDAGRHLQLIEKALAQMHVTLPEVVSDRAGVTGMSILRAIVQGERDPKAFARLREHRCKAKAGPHGRGRGRGRPSTCSRYRSPWRCTIPTTRRAVRVIGSSRSTCRGWRCPRCHR